MKLILEAIRALFRGLESKIPKSLADLLHGEKIPGQAVEDMYYAVPGEYMAILSEQTYEMEIADELINKKIPTYGVDVFDIENLGIIENLYDEVFTVVWDGVEYQCGVGFCKYEMFFVGNPIIAGATDADTGEPFCLLTNGTALAIRTDEPGAHTVSFGPTIKAGKIAKMPKRYLPEHTHREILPIWRGGTGAKNAADARNNLGICTFALQSNGSRLICSKLFDTDQTDGNLVILVANGGVYPTNGSRYVYKANSGKELVELNQNINVNTAAGSAYLAVWQSGKLWLI